MPELEPTHLLSPGNANRRPAVNVNLEPSPTSGPLFSIFLGVLRPNSVTVVKKIILFHF